MVEGLFVFCGSLEVNGLQPRWIYPCGSFSSILKTLGVQLLDPFFILLTIIILYMLSSLVLNSFKKHR